MPHFLSTRTALLLLAPCALAACRPEAAPPAATPPPVATAPAAQAALPAAATRIDAATVAAFLAAQYGPGAKAQGEWTGVPADAALRHQDETDGAVTRKVCAREDATIEGRASVLLAVCGTPKDFGHVTPGITDFWLLQDRDGKLAASARSHLAEYGSMGNAGEVDVERLGAELYGFEVESGFFNMGDGISSRSLLLPKDGAFVEAADMRASLSHGENMDDCDERGDCPADGYDIEFDLDVDDSDPSAAAYPLVVRESGIACRQPAQSEYKLVLDPATMTYAVPKALQRETGCEDAVAR